MPRGRETRALRPDQIKRLESYRKAKRLSLPNLNAALCCPFTWQVLQRAMEGKPVWRDNYDFIAAWLDKWVPATSVPDGKLASSGN